MRTYNVILKKGVDYQSFWDDMENENDGGNLYIPNRRVDSPNLRPNSERQTWYTLSDEEAQTVRNDERVLAVEIPPEDRDDIIMVRRATQNGVFTKTTSDSGNYQNWGLIRCLSKLNNYGTNNTAPTSQYPYSLTGKGVDVVIQDGGVEPTHPEWADRYESVDWGSYSGGAFSQSANHNRDVNGHGTHCAGISAGKTFGWARGAKVISQKIAGLETDSGTDGTGISYTYAFDALKAWHNAKSINPNTGYKRPTVVNMSWGFLTTYTDASIDEINYRGSSYTGLDIDTATERETNYGLINYVAAAGPTYATNVRIASVDADIEELLEAGVHICVAAGNRSHKIDEYGGDDYDNYFGEGVDTPQYYHRGSSPYGDSGQDGTGPKAIIVGNMDSSVSDANTDRKATSSETGPGVDIYAPGTNIMSACSTTNEFATGNYYLNSSYKQMVISGTSMASPQVAGVLACILEIHPEWNPAQAKQWLLDNAGSAILNTGTGNDWTNDRSLKGGAAKVLHMPYSNPKPVNISGFNNLTFNIKIKEL